MRSRLRQKSRPSRVKARKPFFSSPEIVARKTSDGSFFTPDVVHRKDEHRGNNVSTTKLKPSSLVSRKKQQSKDIRKDIDEEKDFISSRFSGDSILEACLRNERFLKVGAIGPAVAKIQQALVDAGFSLENYGVDGHFGQETQAAVKDFQSVSGFVGSEVDGVVGQQTIGKLDSFFVNKPTQKNIDDDRKDKLKHYSTQKKKEAEVRVTDAFRDIIKPFPSTNKHKKEPTTIAKANALLNKSDITTEQRQWLHNALIINGVFQAVQASTELASRGITLDPIRMKIVGIALGEIGRVETLSYKYHNPPKELCYKDKKDQVHKFKIAKIRVGAKRLQEYFEWAAPQKMNAVTFKGIHDRTVPMHGENNEQGLARWCGIFALWVHIAAGNITEEDWGDKGEGAPWPTKGNPKNIPKGGQFEAVTLHKSGNNSKPSWLLKGSEIPKPGDVLNNGNHYGIVIRAGRKAVTFVDGNQGVMRATRLRTESWGGSEWQRFYRAAAKPR